MTTSTVAVIGLLILGWALISGAGARHNITGPMAFAAFGYVLGNPTWGPLPVNAETSSVKTLVELTLALLLFSDAARVNARELRRDLWLPIRLLGVGLLLSVLLGRVLGTWLLAGYPVALAVFLGAALAPTDAALSAQVIDDKRLPLRLRRALNVESGLNDGIATPIVTVALAAAASALTTTGGQETFEPGTAVRELAVGAGVGLALGVACAVLLRAASDRQWMVPGGRRLAALATAVTAYTLAVSLHGNGFIAAFVAGITFGATVDKTTDLERTVELPELGGQVLALVVWFLFGATLLPIAFAHLDLAVVGYALLSLTVIRMGPVVLCLIRSGLDRPSIWFVAWFGPRGLASVVFALLAIEELGQGPGPDRAVATVALTVLMSAIVHGVSAGPLGRRYLQRERATSTAAPRARPSGF
jgi:sodium/hydrogen antiporter